MAKALGEQQRSGIGRDWNQAGALDAGTMAEMNGPKRIITAKKAKKLNLEAPLSDMMLIASLRDE